MHNSRSFVAVVHRRLLLQSFVDRLGILLFCTSLVVILVLPFEIWGHVSAVVVLAAISGITLLIAATLMFRRWPAATDAAELADRQFGLDDLLTTTCHLQPVPFDDLSVVVAVIADARCAQLRPVDVKIARLPARAWGGIVLTAGLAGALMLVPLRSPGTGNTQADAGSLAATVDPQPVGDALHTETGPQISGRDPVGQGESQISSPIDSDDKADPTVANASHGRTQAGGSNSTGGGAAATTKKPGSMQNLESTAAAENSTQLNSTQSKGTASGGGREADEHGDGTDGPAGTTAGRRPASVQMIPAWQSSDWPAAREGALSAVNNGTIPPGCRDLVRDYFR